MVMLKRNEMKEYLIYTCIEAVSVWVFTLAAAAAAAASCCYSFFCSIFFCSIFFEDEHEVVRGHLFHRLGAHPLRRRQVSHSLQISIPPLGIAPPHARGHPSPSVHATIIIVKPQLNFFFLFFFLSSLSSKTDVEEGIKKKKKL